MLGASHWVPRDVQGVHGKHDLDLVFRDGSRFAVEVTTDTAENRAAFYGELERIGSIPAPSLRALADRSFVGLLAVAVVDEFDGDDQGDGEGDLGEAVAGFSVGVAAQLAVVGQP